MATETALAQVAPASSAPSYFSSDIGRAAVFTLVTIPMSVTGLAFYGTFTLKTPIYPPTAGLGARALIVPMAAR